MFLKLRTPIDWDFLPLFVCTACIWHKSFVNLLQLSAFCVWISLVNYLCNVHQLWLTTLFIILLQLLFKWFHTIYAISLYALVLVFAKQAYIVSYLTTVIERKISFHWPNFTEPLRSVDRRKINNEKGFNALAWSHI